MSSSVLNSSMALLEDKSDKKYDAAKLVIGERLLRGKKESRTGISPVRPISTSLLQE